MEKKTSMRTVDWELMRKEYSTGSFAENSDYIRYITRIH